MGAFRSLLPQREGRTMRIPARRTLTRLALGATVVALAGSGSLVAPATARSTAAGTSAGWLADQLTNGLVVSEYNDGTQWVRYKDYGLSLDVYLALTQLGARPAKADSILDAIEPRVHRYVGSTGALYAGAIGKLLTAVETDRRDPRTYGDEDLVADLEGLVVTSGPETGRAKDSGGTDYSNTFGQAFAATALAGAGSSLADEATTFLLKQQCSAGFFRENMESSDFTCDSGDANQSAPSVDATATAALAANSLAVLGPPSVQDAAAHAAHRAVRWLVAHQKANGSFVGNGVANANSTGLAATVLSVAGKQAKARAAAEWISGLRVTPKLARTTAFRAADVGAIAYNGKALKAGKAHGITRDARYQWRRATAQAAPALAFLG